MKKLFSISAAAVLCVVFALTALAFNESYVTDGAELLSPDEEDALSAELKEYSGEIGCQLAVHTVNYTGDEKIEDYGDELYAAQGYGSGGGEDGALLVFNVNPADGTWGYYIAVGGRVRDIIADSVYDEIADGMYDDISDGNYPEAFAFFARSCAREIWAAEETTAAGESGETEEAPDSAPAVLPESAEKTTAAGESGETEKAPDSAPAVLPEGDYCKSFVVDKAGLLTEEEAAEAESRLKAVSARTGLQLAVMSTEYDFTGNGGDKKAQAEEAQAFADDFFDNNRYGFGKQRSGALLVVFNPDNPSARYVHLSTRGRAIKVFTDERIDDILDCMVPDMKSGNYFRAFESFAERSGDCFDKYESEKKDKRNLGLIAAAALAFGVAFVVTKRMKNELISAEEKTEANNFVRKDSLAVSASSDRFLYSTVSKVKRQQKSSSGGSSTHTSSSGATHGGGGRSF